MCCCSPKLFSKLPQLGHYCRPCKLYTW
jgi:hypothetical protein